MEYDIKTILEKIILPIQDGWKLSKLDIDEDKVEVHVYLYYEPTTYKVGDLEYELYDNRTEQKWRHLDLWQYKTFIYCRLYQTHLLYSPYSTQLRKEFLRKAPQMSPDFADFFYF